MILEDIKGKIVHDIEYKYLYHMANHHAFAYAVDNNKLATLRNYYVSTTYDPKNNSYYGGDHAHFKFILDGKKLAKDYGAFTYDFHTTEYDSDSSRTVSLNEREIGINTRSIQPLTDYCKGLIILYPLFSQTMIQWLFYDNPQYKGFMDANKSAAPRGIEALMIFMNKWKLPVFVDGNNPRNLDPKEKEFLNRAWRIHQKGGDFRKAMVKLVSEYPVIDHFKKPMDVSKVKRLMMGQQITNLFNKYFQNRKVSETDPNQTKLIVKTAMNMLNLNSNIQTTIMAEAEKYDLFNPIIPAVEWSIIFGDLFDGDVDAAIDSIKYVGNRNKWALENSKSDLIKNSTHYGTQFSSL